MSAPAGHDRGAPAAVEPLAPAKPVVIKTTEHGPLRVKGPVTLVDADGTPFVVTRKTFFLCRCGASANKPFCDGSHNRVGFRAAERAPSPPA